MSKFHPYQLKTIYKPKTIATAAEIILSDSESDDDDLYDKPQPFETVSRIGYEKHLSYLMTELLFRRSDILVSSTLSFSLTPLEEKRMHLAQMTAAQIKTWVDLKSEFRAMNVSTF
jgi:hypothetical protein